MKLCVLYNYVTLSEVPSSLIILQHLFSGSDNMNSKTILLLTTLRTKIPL